VSVGETPNPAAPFVRLGDGFRPVTFGLDQFYVDVRPLKDKARLWFSLGKMPMPFWRGDRGRRARRWAGTTTSAPWAAS
jgi:hypothetical protein